MMRVNNSNAHYLEGVVLQVIEKDSDKASLEVEVYWKGESRRKIRIPSKVVSGYSKEGDSLIILYDEFARQVRYYNLIQ